MDPRITYQLVTLDPAKPDEQKLCELVIGETGTYLHRDPLCPLKDSIGRVRTAEWLRHYRSTAMGSITVQIKRLEHQFARSSAPVPISRAWKDWQARLEALKPLHECADPAYVATLDELLDDLHAPTPEGNREPVAIENHYVSILVSLSFSEDAQKTLLTRGLWTPSFPGRRQQCTCEWCVTSDPSEALV